MWRNKASYLILLALAAVHLSAGSTPCSAAYVYFHDGKYLASTPETSRSPDRPLDDSLGRAIMERLLKPEHMAIIGLGEYGQGTLSVGDSVKAELVDLFGPAQPLPLGLRCVRNLGYASARPGDGTLVVVGMGSACLDNPDYVVSIAVYFSPAALPKDYRPHLKSFVPSASVHAGLATQSGLRLGLTREEVEEILGAPIWKEKNAYSYGASADMELPAKLLITRWKWPKDVKGKPGAVQQFIDVWFVGGRVSAFQVRKLYDM